MNSSLKFCCSFFLLFFSVSVFATNASDVADLKRRKLIVCILAEDQMLLDSIKADTAKSGQYKRNIKAYNDQLKKAVQKFWTFHKTFECKTIKELDELKKSEAESKKYACLQPQIYAFFKSDVFGKTDLGKIGYLNLRFVEHSRVIAYTTLGQIYPEEQDFVYGVQRMNIAVSGMETGKTQAKILKENAFRIKGKILLIDSAEVEAKLKSKGALVGLPCEVKIVNTKEINNAIISGDSRFAYVLFVDEGDGLWVKTAVLCEDAHWVGYAISRGYSKLSIGDLKKLLKSAK